MRRRVEQLLNGKFEYEVKPLAFSKQNLTGSETAGQKITGDFTITAPDEHKVKGFLYVSDNRIGFEPQRFYGIDNKITYQVDLTGLSKEDRLEGFFTAVTDRGEYQLPYTFSVHSSGDDEETPVEEPSPGELCEIAKADFQKAKMIFRREQYANHLKENEPGAYVVYQGVSDNRDDSGSLEEFFVGCGLKDPVEISLPEGYVQMKAPDRSMKRTAVLNCSDWGYLEMEITSDVRFLRPEKKKITTDSFAGGQYILEYIVDTNFLHAGRNYGRIRISSGYQTLYLEVLVEMCSADEAAKAGRVRNLMRRKMLSLYLDFRMKRMEMHSWIDRTANVIAGYKRAGGTDVFADLFMVQLYFADGKKMKGNRLLTEIENQPERFTNPEQYAFYLYITTFFEQEASYVDQIEAKIEQLFLQRRDSWIIQWILLYLKERYLRDESAKLEAIAIQVNHGCSSPIMYLEACQILRKNPYLLRTLGDFEKRILMFAAKMDLLTEELAYQVGNLVLQNPVYDRRTFRILQACYAHVAAPDLLSAICTILIAGDKRETEHFSWYSMAVASDLRITGLYEYYMETMDARSIETMPQIIRMYFSYNNTLSYHKKAAIYRNISDNRDNIPQVYRSSRPAIDHFVTEQLSLGRIDKNLAVLYERFITRRLLTANLASKLVKLLFTFEVTCKNPKMKSVVVYHGNLRKPQEVPIINGKARVQIYTEDARLFLVDDSGLRYASTSLYMAERFLDSPLLLTFCREYAPDHPGLILYMCSRPEPTTEKTLPYYKAAILTDSFTEREQIRMRRAILLFYLDHPRQEDLYAYLNGMDLTVFARADQGGLMTLLTREGLYEKAFSLVQEYGCEKLDVSCLVRICSQMVLGTEYEENEALIYYCSKCYQFGKYDDNILTYLLMYYDGPIEDMKRLWNTGYQNELDTMVLEEKILSIILFTRTGSAGSERIFASYQRKLGRKKICRAYLIMKAYEYFVKDLPVADIIFSHLEQLYDQENEDMEDVCELALLQYYAKLPSLNPTRKEIVKGLLKYYDAQGKRFAFFQNFPEELTGTCQLEDRVFLEYVTDPKNTVTLFYRMKEEDPFADIPMKNCFEGIFVHEFVLFEGETAECYMRETGPEMEPVETGRRTLYARPVPEGHQSRFAMISKMSGQQIRGEYDALQTEMLGYRQLDYLTKQLFTLQ